MSGFETDDGIPSAPLITLENGTAALIVATTSGELSVDTFASPPKKRVRYWHEVL